MKGKDEQIRKMEETMYGLEAKIKERDTKNKTLQDKVNDTHHNHENNVEYNIFRLLKSLHITFFVRLKNLNHNYWWRGSLLVNM